MIELSEIPGENRLHLNYSTSQFKLFAVLRVVVVMFGWCFFVVLV